MSPEAIHKAAKVGTLILTVAAASLGSFAGVAASGWGGTFVIVPVTTALFTLAGAGLGHAIQLALRLKWPDD